MKHCSFFPCCLFFPPPLSVIFKEEPLLDAPHHSFPHSPSSTSFLPQSPQGNMDFPPSRPPFPYSPERSPPGSTYGPDWSPCTFPVPPRYTPGFSFSSNEAYRGANLSVPLLSPGGLSHFPTLDCRPPHFQPPSPQLGPQPPGHGDSHSGMKTPEWTNPELQPKDHGTKELEKSGFGSGFRDALPIHGITLEEGKSKK